MSHISQQGIYRPSSPYLPTSPGPSLEYCIRTAFSASPTLSETLVVPSLQLKDISLSNSSLWEESRNEGSTVQTFTIKVSPQEKGPQDRAEAVKKNLEKSIESIAQAFELKKKDQTKGLEKSIKAQLSQDQEGMNKIELWAKADKETEKMVRVCLETMKCLCLDDRVDLSCGEYDDFLLKCKNFIEKRSSESFELLTSREQQQADTKALHQVFVSLPECPESLPKEKILELIQTRISRET